MSGPRPGVLSTGRTVAFSDGVFAIALTLLTLALDVPLGTPGSQLGEALRELVPEMLGYALSVAVIGQFWIAHHRTFHEVQRVDGRLLRINLLVLALVAFLPFPTGLLGRYGDQTAAVALYAAVVAAIGAAETALWWYARRAGLLHPATRAEHVALSQGRGLTTVVVFGVSVPVAFVSPTAAILCWALMVPARIGLARRFGSVYGTMRGDEG